MSNLEKEIKNKNLLQSFIFAGLMGLFLYILFSLPRLAAPFAISYLFVLIVSPILPLLMKLGLNKMVALGVVFFIIGLSVIYPIVRYAPLIVNEVKNYQSILPKVETVITERYVKIQTDLDDKYNIYLKTQYLSTGLKHLRKSSTELVEELPNILATTMEWFFLIPLFIIFFVKDGKHFSQLILRLCPNFMFERTYGILHQFQKKLGGYIFAKLVEAIIVGGIIFIGLLFFNYPFAFLLSVIAAITNTIPYLGPILGVIPAILLGLAQFGMGPEVVMIAGIYGVANFIDLAIVFPVLVSKIVDLHPLVVVVSVIVGSQYLGVLGMVISVPIAAAVKLILQNILDIFYNYKLK